MTTYTQKVSTTKGKHNYTNTDMFSISFCFDSSDIMVGCPIKSLNSALPHFFKPFKSIQEIIKFNMITTGGNANCIIESCDMNSINKELKIVSGGLSMLSDAINISLDILDVDKSLSSIFDLMKFRSVMVLLSSSKDHSSRESFIKALERIQAQNISIIPVAIGPEADLDVLRFLSGQKEIIYLKRLKFKEMFQWMSKRMIFEIQSNPNNILNVRIEELSDWASNTYL